MENSLVTAVTNALGTVIDWIGTVITSIIGADGEMNVLLPLFAVGIAISAILFGIVRHVQYLKDTASFFEERTYNLTEGMRA